MPCSVSTASGTIPSLTGCNPDYQNEAAPEEARLKRRRNQRTGAGGRRSFFVIAAMTFVIAVMTIDQVAALGPCFAFISAMPNVAAQRGDDMDLGGRFRIYLAATLLSLAPQMAFADEWWKGAFANEGSSPCDNNDSRVTFTDKSVEMWEVGCTVERLQKLKGLDAIVLDMTCSDDEQSVEKRRSLLLKLDDDKLLRYPENQVLQRCSELEGNAR
ncbi:MAG: hypothetical protein ABIQ51_00970 [Mesorhizobium sp.]